MCLDLFLRSYVDGDIYLGGSGGGGGDLNVLFME